MAIGEEMNLFHTYSFPNTKSIVVCGDIHGEFNAVIYKLCIQYQMTDTVLIIAGDCGFGFEKPGYYDTGWRRSGQGRDDGLELVWWHRGDGYFLQFIWHPNRPSRALQGTSARAVVPICVHRAPRTPPDSAPGHIRSRDD